MKAISLQVVQMLMEGSVVCICIRMFEFRRVSVCLRLQKLNASQSERRAQTIHTSQHVHDARRAYCRYASMGATSHISRSGVCIRVPSFPSTSTVESKSAIVRGSIYAVLHSSSDRGRSYDTCFRREKSLHVWWRLRLEAQRTLFDAYPTVFDRTALRKLWSTTSQRYISLWCVVFSWW